MAEQTNTTTQTTTKVEEKKGYEGDLASQMAIQNGGDSKYKIPAPLFIMFAEYLGYVGKTLGWVDNWVVGKKKPSDWQQKFIEVEAKTVLEEAIKKFGEKRMRMLYDQLYEVILELYDNNLREMESPSESDGDKDVDNRYPDDI